jgi:hypothetical protein
MSETGTPPPLTIVRPGEGREGNVGAHGVVFKLWGEDTGGAVAIVEHPFPVGAAPGCRSPRAPVSTTPWPRCRLSRSARRHLDAQC